MSTVMVGETVGAEERLLLDLSAVARMLSVSRAEVERRVARRELLSCKLGRRRLVSKAQLTAYLERIERGEVA